MTGALTQMFEVWCWILVAAPVTVLMGSKGWKGVEKMILAKSALTLPHRVHSMQQILHGLDPPGHGFAVG